MHKYFFTAISNFWHASLNLLYPQSCLICNDKLNILRRSFICEACANKIGVCATPRSTESQEERFGFDGAFHVATYEDAVKRCIHIFKYDGKTQMANPLGKLMVDFAVRNLNIDRIDVIVPVPLHPRRLRERRFNQSEVLATYVAKGLNKNIVKDKVIRIRYTTPQIELKREERLKNVRGAFRVKECCSFEGKNILLVDDVFTTGATLSECAKALKESGANEVIAFALARGT